MSSLRYVLALLALPCAAWSANLEFTLTGLDGEAESNALAFLGRAPETAQERINFIASARERTESGLQALGYYAAEVHYPSLQAGPCNGANGCPHGYQPAP